MKRQFLKQHAQVSDLYHWMNMVLDVVGDVCRVFFVDYTLYNEPRCVYEYRYVVSRVCCVLVWVQSHASSHMFIGASSQIFIDAISHMFICVISHMFINKTGSDSGTVGISASTLAAGKSLQRVLLHAFYAMLTLQMVGMLLLSKKTPIQPHICWRYLINTIDCIKDRCNSKRLNIMWLILVFFIVQPVVFYFTIN